MDLSTALRSRGPNAGTPTDGSRTMTITRDPTKEHPDSDENEEQGPGGQVVGTLHLRGARRPNNRPRVAWNEDVIDNEGCGKKKSKICCIYHKPRRFDESSDESDSDSDSDSSCSGNPGHNHANHNHANHNHSHNPSSHAGPSSQQSRSNGESGTVHTLERPVESEPNAYEKQPKGKRKA
ncbi:hypothetical protein CPC08DRAFT_716796 [Agrocybe pediades]|nr:hypothetical protein CPC08DRAFT_716796 [Agrocybe pediades]